MQEICHQSFISGIDSNPVAPHGTCNGSAVDSRNAIELLLCLLLILYKYHKRREIYRSQGRNESRPKGPGFALTPEEATRRADSVSPVNAQHSTMSYHVVENMNSRTAEQGTAEYRSEKHCLTAFKNFCCSKFLVRYCPSDSPPCGRVPSFDIQKIEEAESRSNLD